MARSAVADHSKVSSGLDKARKINRIIFGIALFGTLLTIHLWIQSERNFSHGCFGLDDPADIGFIECSAVTQSDAGKLFGISNIVFGFFFFGTIAALSFATILGRNETVAKLRKASLIVATLGIGYALYLFGYQVFVLGMFCKLCLITGFTTAILFTVHAVEWSWKTVPKFDTASLVREIGVFLLVMLLAGLLLVADLFFVNEIGTLTSGAQAEPAAVAADPTPASAPATQPAAVTSTAEDEAESKELAAVAQDEPTPEDVKAQLDAVCRYDDSLPQIANVEQMSVGAPHIGADQTKVTLIEFFDPNCPHCKTLHEATPDIMAQVGDRVKWVFRPYPIWPYSYSQVEALYVAQDQGRFHEMLDAQMDRQKRGGLSLSELVSIAEDIGLDTERFRKDLNGGKYRSRVNREKVQIGRTGINSVPKVAINGRFVAASSINSACIDHFAESIELAS